MDHHFQKINQSNINLLKSFLNSLTEETKTFRYFQNRNISLIKNHLLTLLLYVDNNPVGYGHIDKEREDIWLGIVVRKDFQGRGLGKEILSELINQAKGMHLSKLLLTVDNDNYSAINLYEKFGFKLINEEKDHKLYLLLLCPITIAIPISSYMWAGGAELIGNFLTALNDEYPEYKLYLLHNSHSIATSKILRSIYATTLIFKHGLTSTVKDIKSIISGKDKFFNISDFIKQDKIFKQIQILETDYSAKSLNQIRALYGIDMIFAAAYPITSQYLGKWVGYITDIQHKRFKYNFTYLERIRRDYIFSQILARANTVLVNSLDVKKDLGKYYGQEYLHKIQVLPVCPFTRKEWLVDDHEIATKYKLPKKFFLISSQLWEHKSHITAFKALSIIIKKYPDVDIICTGDTSDYRNPTYFQYLLNQIGVLGISNNVRFMGLIPKIDQIQIMHRSIAVLQPSLFEGGPGGGSVQNAISIGVRSIVADIPINKEINEKTVTYFKSGSEIDLAKKMIDVISNPHSIDKIDTIRQGLKRKILLAKNIIASLHGAYENK